MHAKSAWKQEYMWKAILFFSVADYEAISAFIVFLLTPAQQRSFTSSLKYYDEKYSPQWKNEKLCF